MKRSPASGKSRVVTGGRTRSPRRVRLLFSCAGRRVELISAFQRAARKLGIEPVVHTADSDRYFAASCVSQHSHQIPPVASAAYVPSLLDIVERDKIDLLIPLLDPELMKLAEAREEFARLGCLALISSPEVVRTCQDKLATFAFLTRSGIDTPQTWTPGEVLRRRKHSLPYFLKPREGSASKGGFIVHTREDLKSLAGRSPDVIIQEFVPGVEHTLDVYTGLDGCPRCVVPRERIEVRGGEVTKSRTVKDLRIMEVGRRVAEALQGCVGIVTIQLIVTPQGRIRVIEINPRFGGGAPLSIEAGADSPRWLLEEWLGRRPEIRFDGFRDHLLMLRYHQSFFKIAPPADKS
jgi:carbamoyl-phosphate synthase large subunit